MVSLFGFLGLPPPHSNLFSYLKHLLISVPYIIQWRSQSCAQKDLGPTSCASSWCLFLLHVPQVGSGLGPGHLISGTSCVLDGGLLWSQFGVSHCYQLSGNPDYS